MDYMEKLKLLLLQELENSSLGISACSQSNIDCAIHILFSVMTRGNSHICILLFRPTSIGYYNRCCTDVSLPTSKFHIFMFVKLDSQIERITDCHPSC
jgi:hypothetical protein